MEPRIQVAELQALTEVLEETHQPKPHQEVGNLLASAVLGITYVRIKVYHHNGVLVPEADQGLLRVWEVLQGGGGEVCPDGRGPMASRENLTDYHVQTVEARQLHAPALWSLLDDQAHSPLHAPGSRGGRQRTHQVLAAPVVTINLVGDVGFYLHYHIVISKLDRPNSLGEAKSPAVTDILRLKV